jgi:hypothetical protein
MLLSSLNMRGCILSGPGDLSIFKLSSFFLIVSALIFGNDAIDKCVPKVKINSNTDIKSDKNCPLTRKARAKIKKKNRDYGTD